MEMTRHRCPETVADDMSAFDGLVQGTHYQVCPGCGMKVELAEACNALRCLGHVCRTVFCAICGLRASHDSDHWQFGMPCPRWNKPNDANAGFDPSPEVPEPQRSEEWLRAEALWNTELDSWRDRPWNRVLIRDEKHTLWWLEVSNLAAENRMMMRDASDLQVFNTNLQGMLRLLFLRFGMPNDRLEEAWEHVEHYRIALGDAADFILFRHLLLVQRDALQVIPLHRGIGQQLTRDHLTNLLINYWGKFLSISVFWDSIEPRFMLDYPRVVDMLQRTYDELKWLVEDLFDQLKETAAGPATEPNAANQPDVPDMSDLPMVEDWPNLGGHSLNIYRGLEKERLDRIKKERPRPLWLGAAIDMFWYQHSNANIPKKYQDATSIREQHRLMIFFLLHHQEIELRREEMFASGWPEEAMKQRELWKATMDIYNELHRQFSKKIPAAVVANFERGWLELD